MTPTPIPPLRVGSRVVARRDTAICRAGERGVCFEVYRLDNRPGWSFIFESGRYDGFAPDEVALSLSVTGVVCDELADYEFPHVMRLAADFRQGRFAPAFA
jgi:hypothetical protein